MENQMIIFNSPEFGEVRTIMDEKNNPWFVGKDIAEVLGYKNTKDALAKHVDPEDKLGSQIATSGQRREMTLINESGLYSLIWSSKLPQARAFKRWVTSEVLPAIRKDGGYIATKKDDTPEEIMARAVLVAQETIKRLQKENEALSMKANHLDKVVLCEQCYTTTQIAKELNMTHHELYTILIERHILFKQSKQYMLYANFASLGLAKNRTAEKVMEDGSIKVFHPYLVWTEKGRVFLHNLLKLNPPHVTHRSAIELSQPSLFSIS